MVAAMSAGTVAVLAGISATAVPTSPQSDDGCDGPPRLSEVTGTLQRDDGTFTVGGTEVDFGPDWYLSQTQAAHDYDGDGSAETLLMEFTGLAGATVTLDTDQPGPGGDRDVYTVNGVPYRALDGCPPPWAGGPGGDGPATNRPTGWAPDRDNPRLAGPAFARDMRSWAGCVAKAAPQHDPSLGPFDPAARCGEKPTPPPEADR